MVSHPIDLGPEVVAVVLTDAGDEWHHFDNIDAKIPQLSRLVWILGQQTDSIDANPAKHLCCDSVVAGICGVAKHQIRIDCIGTLVLQIVSLYLGMQSYSSPLLAQL